MPSRPVLIGRGLVTQTLNQNDKEPAQTNNYMFASTNPHKLTKQRAWNTYPVNTHRGPWTARVTAAIAKGKHPVPSRTRKLSLSAPMVLQPRGCGRVGRRRTFFRTGPPLQGWPCFAFWS